MEEGLDHDDRYRMVEDEFLETAKQFTQHLHAAEYQRMKKATRSQNAATINSISRPVTMKMPDSTRRKVESVSSAKKQANALQKLLGKHGRKEVSDESDEDGNAYLGTALHGLMDSPRNFTVSLSNIAPIAATTRAAAGFHRGPTNVFQIFASESPRTKYGAQPKETTQASVALGEDESAEEEYDDLDALARPINLPEQTRQIDPRSARASNLLSQQTRTSTPLARSIKREVVQNDRNQISGSLTSGFTLSAKNKMTTSSTSSNLTDQSIKTDDLFEPGTSNASVESRLRLAKRLEQAKLRKVKKEEDDTKGKRKYFDEIPNFI